MKALTPDSLTQTVRSLRLRRSAVPTFRPQPRDPPDGRFEYQSPQRHQLFQASPLMSRLATRSRRNRFVILRTAGSPPVALHPASRRRSYLQFLGLRPSQARTSTVQTKRPHGTHSPPRKPGGGGDPAPWRESARPIVRWRRSLPWMPAFAGMTTLAVDCESKMAPQALEKAENRIAIGRRPRPLLGPRRALGEGLEPGDHRVAVPVGRPLAIGDRGPVTAEDQRGREAARLDGARRACPPGRDRA